MTPDPRVTVPATAPLFAANDYTSLRRDQRLVLAAATAVRHS